MVTLNYEGGQHATGQHLESRISESCYSYVGHLSAKIATTTAVSQQHFVQSFHLLVDLSPNMFLHFYFPTGQPHTNKPHIRLSYIMY